MSHPTDASGTRNLTEEGNIIKRTLTEPTHKSAAKIQFTSLSQASVPNASARKLLGAQINVTYVPDFYRILDLAQRQFNIAKTDKTITRIEECNIFSYTLYVAYGLMYIYIRTVYLSNPTSNIYLYEVINTLERSGFNSFRLPSFMTQWISGLGEYIDPISHRNFLPVIPTPVDNGPYFDNYFLSPNTSHLLPNFHCILSVICHRILPNIINVPGPLRGNPSLLGNNYAGIPQLAESELSRRNAYRIPGIQHLLRQTHDVELGPLILQALGNDQRETLERYLLIQPTLLSHVKRAISPFLDVIETINISQPTCIGTSLVTIVSRASPNQRVLIPAVNTPARPNAQPPTVQTIYSSLTDHSFKIQARTEIVNGNTDYAMFTPIVRIVDAQEAVILADHIYVDPQDAWYSQSIEFSTDSFTTEETRSYFKRLD